MSRGWINDRLLPTGWATKRAKAVEKTCLRCETGIEKRKTYCGPCRAIRYEETVSANRARYKAARSPQGTASD